MINVTKTFLPDLSEYQAYLEQIWQKAWVTNNGPLVRELEERLKAYLGVKHLLFCTNGTVVIQLALKVLNIHQEVITTPFSYCATATAPLWENATPVFVDIEPQSLCLDPSLIEAAITPQTQAILATHVYGNPCAVEEIEAIARKYQLRVIYDAAHAFGVKVGERSLLSYGDIATCSFHATKVFHSIEGGAIITNDDEIAEKLTLYRSFGHVNDDYFLPGINAKNSEFHAAMGLCVFKHFPDIMARRAVIISAYQKQLDWTHLSRPTISRSDFSYNSAYFPIIFDSEAILLDVVQALKEEGVVPRRYFYPSLNQLPYVKYRACPVSEDIALRILCLPLYYDLAETDVERICRVVNATVLQTT